MSVWIVLFVIRQESSIDSVCYGVALSLRDDSGMKRNQDLNSICYLYISMAIFMLMF